jgi:hypothetical protein
LFINSAPRSLTMLSPHPRPLPATREERVGGEEVRT